MSDSHEEWISRVDQWNKASSSVPVLVREDIVKSKIDFSRPEVPKSLFEDPLLAVQYSMGFKDRINSITYDTLRRVVHQLGVVGAIINTRCNQVASFAVPFRHTKSIGFQIKHKDPTHEVSKGEAEKIKELEDFIYACGAPDANPHNPYKRDDFEAFLKKYVRDSLTFDAACFEVIPDRRGLPYEFVAVDASTIRMAAKHNFSGMVNKDPEEQFVNYGYREFMNRNPYRTLRQIDPARNRVKNPDYVQVLHSQIETVYTRADLAYGIRNPRTDIYTEGYGYGEIEQLITTITSHLNAETYNQKFFTNGSAPKGIINIKGDNFTPDQIEGFKREWKTNVEGVMNAWRTPILQSENGMEFIDLSKSNVDMEFNAWIEYLIKITCAVFLIDPAEINFDLHGGVSQTPLFESSNEGKLKQSRDRGLRPLLRFIAKQINDNVISRIDDHFVFDFIGLDELSETEKQEDYQKKVATTHTLNEIRLMQDLPALEHGDVPQNPVYIQLMAQAEQAEQAAAMQDQAGGEGAEFQEEGGENGEAPPEDEGNTPQYADGFAKSVKDSSFIEITILDDFIDATRGNNDGST